MTVWKRKSRTPLTDEQVEAMLARAKYANEKIERQLKEMQQAQDNLNNQDGPGKPDDSAGAVRIG